MVNEAKFMARIRDIAPPPQGAASRRSSTILGGRWNGGGTGGGTEGQVHVEARAERMELEPTRAEQRN